ncbi:unnamed protein product, partial [Iphiclides podalirius]
MAMLTIQCDVPRKPFFLEPFARREADNLERLMVRGKIEGKRPRGRNPNQNGLPDPAIAGGRNHTGNCNCIAIALRMSKTRPPSTPLGGIPPQPPHATPFEI